MANHNASAGVVQIGGRRRIFIFILHIAILLAFCSEWWLPAGRRATCGLLLLPGPDDHHFVFTALTHEPVTT
ncbi:hypothetical protein LVT71_27760, partial [Klebsiella pneumoniae]|nr:hypothetical protein [Klebsiella pneumoniae]